MSLLRQTRKRVIVQRQLGLLERLLQSDEGIGLDELRRITRNTYADRKEPQVVTYAVVRPWSDFHIEGKENSDSGQSGLADADDRVRFFELLEKLPESKTHRLLASAE